MTDERHYSCSVFKEGSRWAAQILIMPDEEVHRYRTFSTRVEAQIQLDTWKRAIGIK